MRYLRRGREEERRRQLCVGGVSVFVLRHVTGPYSVSPVPVVSGGVSTGSHTAGNTKYRTGKNQISVTSAKIW